MESSIHPGNTDNDILKLNLVNWTYCILVEDSFAIRPSRFLSSVWPEFTRVWWMGGVRINPTTHINRNFMAKRVISKLTIDCKLYN